MTNPHPALSCKIVNSHLARLAFRGTQLFGEFRVIVRLAKHGKLPSYMKAAGPHSPGHLVASIPCAEIGRASNDHDVLSLELREHVIQ